VYLVNDQVLHSTALRYDYDMIRYVTRLFITVYYCMGSITSLSVTKHWIKEQCFSENSYHGNRFILDQSGTQILTFIVIIIIIINIFNVFHDNWSYLVTAYIFQ